MYSDFGILSIYFFCSPSLVVQPWAGPEVGGGEKEMLGKVRGDIRRACSVVVVRSQVLCLLERLAHLEPGERAAAQRRQISLRLEERRRRERQAYQLAHLRRGLSRVGRAFVP